MKIFRIGFVVSALAFAGVGVLNCTGSDSNSDSNGGSGGGGGGSGGGGGKGGSGGGGGTASGGGGGSASGGGGGSASGGGGGAAGGGGGAAGGGAGGAMGGAGGAMGGAGGTAAVTFDGKIKAIYADKCMPCHITGTSGGIDLKKYSDTQKTGGAPICAGKKVGECTLIRIKDGSMPKDATCSGNPTMDAAKTKCVTKAQQDDLQAWIAGGMKEK